MMIRIKVPRPMYMMLLSSWERVCELVRLACSRAPAAANPAGRGGDPPRPTASLLGFLAELGGGSDKESSLSKRLSPRARAASALAAMAVAGSATWGVLAAPASAKQHKTDDANAQAQVGDTTTTTEADGTTSTTRRSTTTTDERGTTSTTRSSGTTTTTVQAAQPVRGQANFTG